MCPDAPSQLHLGRPFQTKDMGVLGISTIAKHAGGQLQLLMCMLIQTMDKGEPGIAATAGCAGTHTQLLLRKSMETTLWLLLLILHSAPSPLNERLPPNGLYC